MASTTMERVNSATPYGGTEPDVFSGQWLVESTREQVLAAVGDDAERARQMATLEADTSNGYKGRKVLIRDLDKIAKAGGH